MRAMHVCVSVQAACCVLINVKNLSKYQFGKWLASPQVSELNGIESANIAYVLR